MRHFMSADILFSLSGLNLGLSSFSFSPFPSVSHRTTIVLCQGIHKLKTEEAHVLSLESKYCAILSSQPLFGVSIIRHMLQRKKLKLSNFPKFTCGRNKQYLLYDVVSTVY